MTLEDFCKKLSSIGDVVIDVLALHLCMLAISPDCASATIWYVHGKSEHFYFNPNAQEVSKIAEAFGFAPGEINHFTNCNINIEQPICESSGYLIGFDMTGSSRKTTVVISREGANDVSAKSDYSTLGAIVRIFM